MQIVQVQEEVPADIVQNIKLTKEVCRNGKVKFLLRVLASSSAQVFAKYQNMVIDYIAV